MILPAVFPSALPLRCITPHLPTPAHSSSNPPSTKPSILSFYWRFPFCPTMPSQVGRHSNSRIGLLGPRRFGTPLPMNTGGGSSSQGGASSAAGSASSSRRYTVPSSDRRGGKRAASQGSGSRNQRARMADEDENDGDVDPIEDAMEIVEVCLFSFDCRQAFGRALSLFSR